MAEVKVAKKDGKGKKAGKTESAVAVAEVTPVKSPKANGADKKKAKPEVAASPAKAPRRMARTKKQGERAAIRR